ncbi:hypothetical protein D6D26_10491 [Aureobasidium pullulans]|nr:hypothetical protein D6D26_10491 [Aureobasidium pullulans]
MIPYPRHDSRFSTCQKLGLLSRSRVVDPSSGIIDPRRVSGGCSLPCEAGMKIRSRKSVHETRQCKNIAIDMLLMINESTWKETALYYDLLTFGREIISRKVRREKDTMIFLS